MFRTDASPEPRFTDTLQLDLGDVVPNLAGPRRPQDRVPLSDVKADLRGRARGMADARASGNGKQVERFESEGGGTAVATEPRTALSDGAVVIAAITSCTNTSNPALHDRGRLAGKESGAQGPQRAPVGEDVACTRLESRDRLSRQSGTARRFSISSASIWSATAARPASGIADRCADDVARGGRRARPDRRGGAERQPQLRRPHPPASARELFGLAAAGRRVRARRPHGHRSHDRTAGPRRRRRGRLPQGPLADAAARCKRRWRASVDDEMFRTRYADVFGGDARWRDLQVPAGERYAWDEKSNTSNSRRTSTGMPAQPRRRADIAGARVLAVLGDSVTTDHISPAGNIAAHSPGRTVPDRARHRSRTTSTPTARAAATTK